MNRRALVWLALLVFAWQAWRSISWTSDDAFISLRYAERYAAGQGYTYNDGERVEGLTNHLWVLALSLLIRLGIDPIVAMKLLGLACAFEALLLTGRLEERLGLGRWTGAGMLIAASHPAFVMYAVSGMETPMTALFLAAAALGMARAAALRQAPGWRVGLSLAGAALCRPDLALAFPLVFLLVPRPAGVGWASYGRFTRAFLIPMATGAACRWMCFGSLTPNTYYVKATGPLAARLDWGVDYLAQLASAQLNVLLLAAVLLACLAAPGARWALGTVLANLAFWGWVGGDRCFDWFRPMGNLVPLLAPWAVLGVLTAARGAGRPALGAALLCLAAAFNVRETQLARGLLHTRTAGRGTPGVALTDFPGHMAAYPAIAEWLGAHAKRGAVLCFDEVGYIPYATKLTTVDPIGLTDAFLARLYAERGYASYFHAWLDPAVVAAVHARARDYILDVRRVDYILFAAEGKGPTGHPAMVGLRDDPRFRTGYREAARFSWPEGRARFILFERLPSR